MFDALSGNFDFLQELDRLQGSAINNDRFNAVTARLPETLLSMILSSAGVIRVFRLFVRYLIELSPSCLC